MTLTRISEKNVNLIYGIWSELAILTRMVMELAVILTWYLTLMPSLTSGIPAVLFLSSGLVLSHYFSRLLHNFDWGAAAKRSAYAIWLITWLVLGMQVLYFSTHLISLKNFVTMVLRFDDPTAVVEAFWTLFFTLIVNLRGISMARFAVTIREAIVNFRLSLILIIAYAIVFSHSIPDNFLITFFVFMLFALLSMSFARIADLSSSHGGRLPGFGYQWGLGILLGSLIVTILSLVSTEIVSMKVAEFLGSGVTVLLQLLLGLIVLVSSPILLAVVAGIQFILKLLAPNLAPITDTINLDTGNELLNQFQEQVSKSINVDPRSMIMLGILVIFVIIVLIQLRWNPLNRLLRGEEGSVQSVGNLKITSPLKNLFTAGFRRRRKASASSLLAAAQVRRIYAQLMELCYRLGKPRPRSATPLEFLPKMELIFPQNALGLALITQAYVKIRYGEYPETTEEIEDVMNAWEDISKYGKFVLDQRKKKSRQDE
jgi:preprotein translocase subunit Sec61beta